MNSSYRKIFSGNRYTVQRIEEKLNEIEVTPIIKDESESARLAGFAANVGGELEIHVHEDEYERAMMCDLACIPACTFPYFHNEPLSRPQLPYGSFFPTFQGSIGCKHKVPLEAPPHKEDKLFVSKGGRIDQYD